MGGRRFLRTTVFALSAIVAISLIGCSSPSAGKRAAGGPVESGATPKMLPDSAYYLNEDLPAWKDPDTGYDTTRAWKLDGGRWPVMLVMSPSQSPQLLAGWKAGLYQEALKEHGIEAAMERIDGPPRTFHALERSKWPFVYMPLAVFMDYVRSADNQGGAGGLQYVALAGSTAGGGYTLMARDGSITGLADLKGKKVGFLNTNPVPGTIFTKALEEAGLKSEDVEFVFAPAGEQLNRYGKGEFDAVVTLNIYRQQLVEMGSQIVTDFAGVSYRPNYTILCVERTVLEKRPEVVESFLTAHYEANKLAEEQWEDEMPAMLLESWNGFFKAEGTKWAEQRVVPDVDAYKGMLGKMWPEQRLDKQLLQDCFDFNTEHKTWGWNAAVDTRKLIDPTPYNDILAKHGEAPQ